MSNPQSRLGIVTVTNKDNLAQLKELAGVGWEFISTGGTADKLATLDVPYIPIDLITGIPEMLNGRVKTLSHKIFGGLLARRDDPAHMSVLGKLKIKPIDMVICNLYAFVQKPSVDELDVGGPSLVRAGVKNGLPVLVDPADYDWVFAEHLHTGTISMATRETLAIKAITMTARYDAEILGWMKIQKMVGHPFLVPPAVSAH